MSNTVQIFHCHLCDDRRDFDLQSMTEHLASAHLNGFYNLRCPRCEAKFVTFYKAALHLDSCDAPNVNEWNISNRASFFEKQQELNQMISDVIKKQFEEAPGDESHKVDHIDDQGDDDNEDGDSLASMNVEPSDDEPLDEETPTEATVNVSKRKRRMDVASASLDLPPHQPLYMKDVDLMSLPQIRDPSLQQSSSIATSSSQPASSWYFSTPGPTATVRNQPKNASKLMGPMPVKNLLKFDRKSEDFDVQIEIEGTQATMYIGKQMLDQCSPYFKQLLSSPQYEKEKKLRLDCAFPSFLDAMNIIYSRPLPWLFVCEGYFKIPTVHRIVRLLNIANQLQMSVVSAFAGTELFKQRCGSSSPSPCACTGCIDRVAVAIYYGIPVPKSLTFTKQAAFKWIQENEAFSCAPELGVARAVTNYLKPFLSKEI